MYRSILPCLILCFLMQRITSAHGETGPTTAAAAPRLDKRGDTLPEGAIARFGTSRFRAPTGVCSVALSPDGNLIAIAGEDRAIDVMDARTGVIIRQIPPIDDRPSGLVFSHDGALLGDSKDGGAIHLWEVASGKLLRTFDKGGIGDRRDDVAFSAGDRILAATVGGSRTIRGLGQIHAWDLIGGKSLGSVSVIQQELIHVTSSANGKMLATWGSPNWESSSDDFANGMRMENTVQLWQLPGWKEVHRLHLQNGYGVTAAAFSPDQRLLAVATNPGPLRLFDVNSGKELRRFGDTISPIATKFPMLGVRSVLNFSSDGTRLLVAGHCFKKGEEYLESSGDYAQVWEVATGKRLADRRSPRTAASWMCTGARVFAHDVCGQTVRIWNLLSAEPTAATAGHSGRVAAIEFAPDHKTLLSAGCTGDVCTWNMISHVGVDKVVLKLPDVSPTWNSLFGVDTWEGFNTAFEPLCHGVLVEDDTSGGFGVRHWGLANGRLIHEAPGLITAHLPACYSSDGKTLALTGPHAKEDRYTENGVDVAKERDMVVIYGGDSNRARRGLRGLDGAVQALALSPDGRLAAAAVTSRDAKAHELKSEICVWETAGGKQVARFATIQDETPFRDQQQGLVFSPDATMLAYVDRNQAINIHDAATGRRVCVLPSGDGRRGPLAFSPDCYTLAVGLRRAVRAGRERDRTHGHIQIWELASGAMRKEFLGHVGDTTALSFSDDDRMLASGGMDTTVLLWDATGLPYPPARRRLGPVEAEAAWRDLSSTSATRGYEAVLQLLGAPADALPLFRTKLHPIPPAPDNNELRGLVAALDSSRFVERESAVARLLEAGGPALPILRHDLQRSVSADHRQRTQQLIDAIESPRSLAANLQMSRAVEVLENLKAPDARELLQLMARGRPDAWATRRAKWALSQLPSSR